MSSEYKMPARCVRCGVEEPTATGLIAKQADNRWVRFTWERSKLRNSPCRPVKVVKARWIATLNLC